MQIGWERNGIELESKPSKFRFNWVETDRPGYSSTQMLHPRPANIPLHRISAGGPPFVFHLQFALEDVIAVGAQGAEAADSN
jgi:hypothetical protein